MDNFYYYFYQKKKYTIKYIHNDMKIITNIYTKIIIIRHIFV